MRIFGRLRFGVNGRFCNIKKRYRVNCGLPFFRTDEVDFVMWQWIESILSEPNRLAKAFEDHQEGVLKAHTPALQMIEANRKKVEALGQEKALLKNAYKAGIIEIEEFSKDRVEIDKDITTLLQAVDLLQEELRPQMLSSEDMTTIEAFAANIRNGIISAADNPHSQREIYQLLNLHVSLYEQDGQKWLDARCMLGQHRSETNYGTTVYTGRNNDRAAESVPRAFPSLRHHLFR
jgi:hypothetical protein